jgi:plasmid stabilization system protein ParE
VTRYILSEDTDRDLNSIWDYIATDNVDPADRWVGKLFDAFDAIGDTPSIGHKREDLTAYPVLFWPVGTYLVIYRATLRPVEMTQMALNFLSGHLKSGQRWSGQNRPTRVTGTLLFLSCRLLCWQVYFRAPTAWAAFEHVSVMEQSVQHGSDGRAVAE